MPLILSLALGAVGLVLIRSAFATPPDPREVLRSLFAGGSLFEPTGIPSQDAIDVAARHTDIDESRHSALTPPPNPNTNRYVT